MKSEKWRKINIFCQWTLCVKSLLFVCDCLTIQISKYSGSFIFNQHCYKFFFFNFSNFSIVCQLSPWANLQWATCHVESFHSDQVMIGATFLGCTGATTFLRRISGATCLRWSESEFLRCSAEGKEVTSYEGFMNIHNLPKICH